MSRIFLMLFSGSFVLGNNALKIVFAKYVFMEYFVKLDNRVFILPAKNVSRETRCAFDSD